jgi:hypothetical protein
MGARDAPAVPPDARRLLGLLVPFGRWPGRLGSVVLVAYTNLPPGAWSGRLTRRPYVGFTTWQPLADERPRS